MSVRRINHRKSRTWLRDTEKTNQALIEFRKKGRVSVELEKHLMDFLHTAEGASWAKAHLLTKEQLRSISEAMEKVKAEKPRK